MVAFVKPAAPLLEAIASPAKQSIEQKSIAKVRPAREFKSEENARSATPLIFCKMSLKNQKSIKDQMSLKER